MSITSALPISHNFDLIPDRTISGSDPLKHVRLEVKLAQKSLKALSPSDPKSLKLKEFKKITSIKEFLLEALDWTTFIASWAPVNMLLTPIFSLIAAVTGGIWLFVIKKQESHHHQFLTEFLKIQRNQLKSGEKLAAEEILKVVTDKAVIELANAKWNTRLAAIDYSFLLLQSLVTVPLAVAVLAGLTCEHPMGAINWAFIGLSIAAAGLGLLYLYYKHPNIFKQTVKTIQSAYFSALENLTSWATAAARESKNSQLLGARLRQIALAELLLEVDVAKQVNPKDRARIDRYKTEMKDLPNKTELFDRWTQRAAKLSYSLSQLNFKVEVWKEKRLELNESLQEANYYDLVRQQHGFNPGKDNNRGFREVILETFEVQEKPTAAYLSYGKKLTGVNLDLDSIETFKQNPKEFKKALWKMQFHPTNQDVLDCVALTAREGKAIPVSVKRFLQKEMGLKGIPETYTEEIIGKIAKLKDPFGLAGAAQKILHADPKLKDPVTLELLKLLKITPKKLFSADADEEQVAKDLEQAIKTFFTMDNEAFLAFIKKLQALADVGTAAPEGAEQKDRKYNT